MDQVKTNDVQHLSPENTIQNNAPSDITTPFKTCLFWPEKKKTERQRKLKEKLPSVATSTQWKEYHLKKQKEKEMKEADEENRKRLRDDKKSQQQT